MNRIQIDALEYLPYSMATEYKRGQEIYNQGDPATHLYLVVKGSVKVWRIAPKGHSIVIGLYLTEELFGESALTSQERREQATAMELTSVMAWSVEQVKHLMMQRPKLAVALLSVLATRSSGFLDRVEGFSTGTIAKRLASALIHFGERSGVEAPGGCIRMGPFTHEFLAEYVGTSREVITHYLTDFRRQGHVVYSRKHITIDRAALSEIAAGHWSGAVTEDRSKAGMESAPSPRQSDEEDPPSALCCSDAVATAPAPAPLQR